MRKIVKLALALIVVGLVGVLGLLFAGTGYGSQDVNIEKTFKEKNVDQLSVESNLADVKIHPGTSEQIKTKLVGQKNKGVNVDLQTSENNGIVRLDAIQKQKNQLLDFISDRMHPLQLHVYLPKKQYKSLTVKTKVAVIEVDQKLSAKKLTVQTDTGEIKLNGYEGNRLNGKTDVGDITLKGIDSPVDVKTNTGNVELAAADGFKGNNRIKADISDVIIRTSKEPISLRVDLHTQLGDIKTDFPISSENKENDDLVEKQVKGFIGKEKPNGQGPTLMIQTDNGDISLKK
ncbi:Putative adhesin [Marininema mesophilum]|uniref:Putative adhesin n=1 Tax=Marininema mesophilum TaxID=1048340 RepID=A0A1H2YTU1_9BACL|nr:DUF4097 family beta strand repeat-containing protein [Marininema mesophilum]SDX08612.1 Putative adhesin [Marininema mesophilum]